MRDFRFSLLLLCFWTIAGFAEVIENGGYRYRTAPIDDAFTQHAVAESWPDDYSADAPFRIWLLDHQSVLGRGEYTDYVFEARSADTLQNVANFSIDFAPSWQELVIHEISVWRDGRWQSRNSKDSITLSRREAGFESGVYDGNVSALVVFKDVAVNEPMRVRYSLLGVHPLIDAGNGLRSPLAWDQPILERRITVSAPQGQTLVWQVSGREREFALPASAMTERPERVTVHLQRLPLLRSIDQMPRDEEPYPYLLVTPKQSWSDVQATARSWFATALSEPSADIVTLADALHGRDDKAVDPKEYTLKALRHVQEKVRYFAILIGQSTHQPHAPSEVLARGYGDCKDKTQLLTALLRAKGIDASPALVHSSRQTAIGEDAPGFSSFDHVIVRARIDGKDYWLDPTWTSQGGNLETQGFPDFGLALPLFTAEPASALVAMLPPEAARSRIESEEQFVVSKEGNTTLNVTTVWRGGIADSTRSRIAQSGKSKMSADYKQFYERSFGKSIDAHMEYRDATADNTITALERYGFASLWTHTQGNRYADFAAQTAQSVLRMPNVVDRTLGLYFAHPTESVERLKITLPEAGRYVSNPEPVHIEDAAFIYTRTVTRHDRELEVVHALRSKKDHVSMKELESHLEHRRQALEAASMRIFWRHKGDAAASEEQAKDRQERYRRLLDKLREQQP